MVTVSGKFNSFLIEGFNREIPFKILLIGDFDSYWQNGLLRYFIPKGNRIDAYNVSKLLLSSPPNFFQKGVQLLIAIQERKKKYHFFEKEKAPDLSQEQMYQYSFR